MNHCYEFCYETNDLQLWKSLPLMFFGGVKINTIITVFPARLITVKQKPQCHLTPAVSIFPVITCLNVCTLKGLRNSICVNQITQLTWGHSPEQSSL